jgi:hypothetical protein
MVVSLLCLAAQDSDSCSTFSPNGRSLNSFDRFADFADELDEPADKVSDIFPHPTEDHLHIIVQLPAAGEWNSLFSCMRNTDENVPPFTTCPPALIPSFRCCSSLRHRSMYLSFMTNHVRSCCLILDQPTFKRARVDVVHGSNSTRK